MRVVDINSRRSECDEEEGVNESIVIGRRWWWFGRRQDGVRVGYR